MLHIYIYVNGIRKPNADSFYSLRIPLTRCGFHLQFRNPQQLIFQLYKYLIVCLWIPQTVLGSASTVADSGSNLELYSVLGICLLNPKQRRRSKKSSKVAFSATNLILACCGIRLQCTECTVWPRKERQFKVRQTKVIKML